jgi:hypothetical protein
MSLPRGNSTPIAAALRQAIGGACWRASSTGMVRRVGSAGLRLQVGRPLVVLLRLLQLEPLLVRPSQVAVQRCQQRNYRRIAHAARAAPREVERVGLASQALQLREGLVQPPQVQQRDRHLPVPLDLLHRATRAP